MELAVTNFRIEIDNKIVIPETVESFNFNTKLELKSVKFDSNKSLKTPLERNNLKNQENPPSQGQNIIHNEEIMRDYLQDMDEELKNLKSTTPQEVSYSQIPLESFELQVDLINHLSSSGNMEKFQYDIGTKPDGLNYEAEQMRQLRDSIKEAEEKANDESNREIERKESMASKLQIEGIEDIYH